MLFWFLTFPFLLLAESWAEKTFSQMTLDDKIGQIFVAPACPKRGDDHKEDWNTLLDWFHIGNAIVKHSDPVTQVRFLNDLQRRAKVPLLIAADAEWGLAMRMEDTIAYPKNQILGAIGDLNHIYQVGKEIGRQAKRVGIHINLAPVADINTNPQNPIIGDRSFGSDPLHVADCTVAMVRGLQDAGILATAKHFPGHGDTIIDSHRGLPVIPHTRQRLDEVELVPFRKAIQAGVGAIMTGHLLVLALDPEHPATLSSPCLTELLRNELGFQGLIITDALNMKALTQTQTPGEIAVAAFQAGCDLLLYGDHLAPNIDQILRDDIPQAWIALKKGFKEGTLSRAQLDTSVKRILAAKELLGLHLGTEVSEEGIFEALHSEEAIRLSN